MYVYIHAYRVYISNLLIRYPRVCFSYHNFLDKRLVLRRIRSYYVDVITSRVFRSPQWLQNICTTYDHKYLPFVIIAILFFLHSCHWILKKSYTMGVYSGAGTVYLPGHLSSPPVLVGFVILTKIWRYQIGN